MIIASDQKVAWDETGHMLLGPPGRDTAAIFDITLPEAPRLVTSLPVTNSVIGPPLSAAIAPDQQVALVANSMQWRKHDKTWKYEPDNKVFVLDLKAEPPRVSATLLVGWQPSGLDINRAGTLALVANRSDQTISVLAIAGRQVKVVDTVFMKDDVTSVTFTPDGKRALVVKQASHKIAFLNVDQNRVTYTGIDVAVGMWPYGVVITPNGKLALTADLGSKGGSDGVLDTVTVIDISGRPPKVLNRVDVGDGPEGLAISPDGKTAAVAVLRGSNAGAMPYYNRHGVVIGLKIDGKHVTTTNEVEVRGLPEGLVFSPDGKYLYVGNFIDANVSILRIVDSTLVDTGKRLDLPGHPAAMR